MNIEDSMIFAREEVLGTRLQFESNTVTALIV